jgi:hypothetical protein
MKQGNKDIYWLMKISGQNNYHECEKEYSRIMAEARQWLASHEMVDSLRSRYNYLLDCGECIESAVWAAAQVKKPCIIQDGEQLMFMLSMGMLLAAGKENYDRRADNKSGGKGIGQENGNAG